MEISLSNEKRFKMYKEMLKYDSRVWRHEHYIAKVLINVFMGNFSMVMIYKLYYHHFDIKNSFLKSLIKPRFLFWTAFTLCVNSSLIYLNYFILPKAIYEEFYSKAVLNDTDFQDLYDHTVTKKKLFK
jgi:hypothetical protein